MRYCKHTQWLGLATNNGLVHFECTNRLATLMDDLPDPDTQRPSLVIFIGNRTKSVAIKELVNTYAPPRRYNCEAQPDQRSWTTLYNGRRNHGEIHLHVNSSSIFSEKPVLLAEGDLPVLERSKRGSVIDHCHETTSWELPTNATLGAMSSAADLIYFRLLSPFTDAICFFADDLGGFAPIVYRLAIWLDLGIPSSLPKGTRPHIIVVTEGAQDDENSDTLLFYAMLREETPRNFSEQFSGLSIVKILPQTQVSNQARHRRLEEHLLAASDTVRMAREDTRTLFSASHFASFFDLNCRHVGKTVVEPFNFIAASRITNPVATDLQQHLCTFLRTIKTTEQLRGFAIPVIASCLLLDSYPPDMHYFDALDVFRSLYKEVCQQVSRRGVLIYEAGQYLLPSGFIRLLEDEYGRQVIDFTAQCDKSLVECHQGALSRYLNYWQDVHSVETCLSCLRRRPQYRHGCGHFVCEICIRIMGVCEEPWSFRVEKCFLCGAETPRFILKTLPATATVRLLSIDGGGARGIAPLTFLQVLEEKIGLPLPIQEHFDFGFGTSSGGIIILTLFINGWPVEDCVDHFERLTKLAFSRQAIRCLPIVSQIRGFLLSLLTDRLYPARNLEAALQEVFGTTRSVLDYSNATMTGSKIGITASSMEPKPFLFTNYNGTGNRNNADYDVLLGNVSLWEIARCTSAAPWFFSTKSITGIGKFQDGGLKYNNPLKLALKEIEAQFPGDPSAKRSTLKVSLGTGIGGKQHQRQRWWWGDLWFFRLLRTLLSSMDSQEKSDSIHRKVLRSQEEEKRTGMLRRMGEYFRFNIEFCGKEPRLDDTERMQEVKAIARDTICRSKQIDHLARCMIAELFVFELDIVPRKENGQYVCTGYIYCRLQASSEAFPNLLGRLATSSARFLLRGRVLYGSLQDRSSLSRDGNVRKRISFTVKSKDELVSLHLKEEGFESCNISGSPFSITWLIKAQGLELPFGREDHVSCKRKRVSYQDQGRIRKRQRI